MNRRTAAIVTSACALGAFLILTPAAVFAEPLFAQTNPIVTTSYHDVSLPVREYPLYAGPWRGLMPEPRRNPFPHFDPRPDPVLQDLEVYPQAPVSATIVANFDGIKDRDGNAPPDTNASVGATQVVETVNVSWQVFDKTGHTVFGPAEIGSIFTGMSSTCGKAIASNNFTDPVVVYDKAAARWVVTIEGSSHNNNSECIAVSTSPDASGTYNRYDFSFGTIFPDYPKIGVWSDAYYGGFDTFNPGAEACAFQRANMLIGAGAISVCFQRGSKDFDMLPSDIDGSTPPNPGEPAFFVEQSVAQKASFLNLYQFHVDFMTPSNSTFTGPAVIAVPAYTDPCGFSGVCVPQLGTTQKLDSLSGFMMFRLAYRNFGTFESLVVNHPVKGATAQVDDRWYEIRNPMSPVLYQSGTVASGSTSLWMGSIAEDKAGDMALGFSDSSTTLHPGIEFTGRVPTDPLGMMEGLKSILIGTGSQNGGLNRWGDYSSMSIDPVDDCTFWYAQEYQKTNGSFNWHTRLAALKFSGCH